MPISPIPATTPALPSTPAAPVLDVRNLHVSLPTRTGALQAVRGIDLRIERGATLGPVSYTHLTLPTKA